MSTATITCLCAAFHIPYEQPLPAKTELCHCKSCRHTSSGLFEGFVSLPESPGADVLARCTSYASSKTHTRYFCPTCGTKLFINSRYLSDGTPRDDSRAWFALGGAVDPPNKGVEDVLSVDINMWLADTGDGGLAPYLRKLGGRDVACYQTYSGHMSDDEVNQLVESSKTLSQTASDQDWFKAECRCGGVSLQIQKANHADRTVSKLDRYIPRDRDGKVENDKHFSSACVCRSCRLHFGVSLAPWLYIPPAQILNPHTGEAVVQHHEAMAEEASKGANTGLSLKHYWSRKDCCRSFCSTCGAAVFYTRDDRPEITNIAAGLVRAEEGVMARRWLSWQWGLVSFEQEATDRSIVEAWKATAEPWMKREPEFA